MEHFTYDPEALADVLTDMQFELLVRHRINRLFAAALSRKPNLGEHHNYCFYTHSWGDEARWSVKVGENYNNKGEADGQVLSMTLADAVDAYSRRNANKLSLLLPSPETAPLAAE